MIHLQPDELLGQGSAQFRQFRVIPRVNQRRGVRRSTRHPPL